MREAELEMNDEMKKKKLADSLLETVSGGSNREVESDMLLYARLTGKKPGSVVVDDVIDAFSKANITLEINTDDGNVYKNSIGTRISRYSALVLLCRSMDKGDFDISGYMGSTHGDNIINQK